MGRTVHVHVVCWNERDLVPWIYAHYSQFATRIFFHDNFSDDGTRELIAGRPLAEVVDFRTGGEIRDDLLQQLKNTCWKGQGADWVVCCDADEFVTAPTCDFHTALDAYESRRVAVPQCGWVEMVGTGIPRYAPGEQLCSRIRFGVAAPPTKCLLFNAQHLSDINYTVGAHICRPNLEPGWNGPMNVSPPVSVLHFKFARGLAGVLERHTLSARRLSRINRRFRWGWHYVDSAPSVEAHRKLMEARQDIGSLFDRPDPGRAVPNRVLVGLADGDRTA